MIPVAHRHAVQALVRSGLATKDVAAQMGISVRSVQRIAKEPPVSEPDDQRARRARRVGRPPIPDHVVQRLRELVAEDPQAPPMEVLRQLREEEITLGESTFYRIFRIEKAKLPSEPMVRFEGVAGEFAEFDFGVARHAAGSPGRRRQNGLPDRRRHAVRHGEKS